MGDRIRTHLDDLERRRLLAARDLDQCAKALEAAATAYAAARLVIDDLDERIDAWKAIDDVSDDIF